MDLSIPASSLQSAIAAFEGGADSVYFGLSEFSARKGATNFSFNDLRRIKQYALTHDKKIYVAFNTIINDEDMDRAYHLLKQINFIGVDGLIVQDFGIVNLCKREFPLIPLHASTQMAVLNKEGVIALKTLGFTRVVLARELSLEQIEKIRNEVKDIELKVFIHGALCYSISGLCYASFALTNGETSANKGSCAGVCRWPFRKDGVDSKNAPFSLSDVESDKNIIKRLQEIGVDALKVEGRLKNSLYAKNAALYYRSILDGKSDKEIEENKERLECAFARKNSTGYFIDDSDLDCSDYVGHRGYKIGKFLSENEVLLTSSISLHDGLFYIDKNGNAQKCASLVKNAKSGDTILLKGANAKINSFLYKTKKSDENEKSFKENSYKMYMKPLDIDFRIENDRVFVNNSEFSAPIQKALKKQNLEENLKSLFSTQKGLYTIGRLNIINHTSIENSEVFIPLSILKKIKNEFYERENGKTEAGFLASYTPPKIDDINENQTSDIIFQQDSNITSVIINNISDVLPFLKENNNNSQDKAPQAITISPLMNIANREAVEFFTKLFNGHSIHLCSSLEACPDKIRPCVKDSTECLKEYPIFTSLSNLPEDGIYTTTFKGKTYRLKVISEKDLVKTYLM